MQFLDSASKDSSTGLASRSCYCRSPGPPSHVVDRRMVNPAQAPLNRMRTPSPAVPWNDLDLKMESVRFATAILAIPYTVRRSFHIMVNDVLFSSMYRHEYLTWTLRFHMFSLWLLWENLRFGTFFLQLTATQCFLYLCSCSAVGCNCCSPYLLA